MALRYNWLWLSLVFLGLVVATPQAASARGRRAHHASHFSGPQIIRVGQTGGAANTVDEGVLVGRYGFHALAEGQLAPDFELRTAEDHVRALTDFRGHWVLLNFVAPWCGSCIKELPTLESLGKSVGARAHIVTVLTAVRDESDSVAGFKQRYRLSLPVLFDQDNSVARAYGITGFPTAFLINPKGNLVGMRVGGRDWRPVGSMFKALRN